MAKVAQQVAEDAPVQTPERPRPRRVRRRPSQPRRVIESPWFTSREAMAFLGFDSISVLYYHIRENQLPFHRIGGRYRFNRLELQAWVEPPEQKAALRAVI